MYVVTYKLPGREKTYSAKTIPLAHKEFLKNYAEAAGQVKKVNIEKYVDPNFKIVVSYPTFRDYFANIPRDMKETNAAWMEGVIADKYWDPTEGDN